MLLYMPSTVDTEAAKGPNNEHVEPSQHTRKHSSGTPITSHMILRSQAWLAVVRTLDAYFTEYRATMADISQIEQRRGAKVAQLVASDQLLGAGEHGIVDVVKEIHAMHEKELEVQAKEIRLLDEDVLPKLKSLTMGLNKSVSDFKQLSQSMDRKEHIEDKRKAFETEAGKFVSAIEAVKAGKTPSTDPYVLKVSTEAQRCGYKSLLQKKVEDQSFAKDATINVDASVAEELQSISRSFAVCQGERAQNLRQTSENLVHGFMEKNSLHEFNKWQERNPGVFEDLSTDDITYPYQRSTLAKVVLQGPLQRRTKYLRSFVSGEFVLTPSTLIELKNGMPSLGIDLDDAKVIHDSKHATNDRFVLHARQVGSSSGRFHTWIFRTTESEAWLQALETVLGHKSPSERALAAFGSLTDAPDADMSGKQKNEMDQVTDQLSDKEGTLTQGSMKTSQKSPAVGEGGCEKSEKTLRMPSPEPIFGSPQERNVGEEPESDRLEKRKQGSQNMGMDDESSSRVNVDGLDNTEKESPRKVFEASLDSSSTFPTTKETSVSDSGPELGDSNQLNMVDTSGGSSFEDQVNADEAQTKKRDLRLSVIPINHKVSQGIGSATSERNHDYDADSDVSEVPEEHTYRTLITSKEAGSDFATFWGSENSCDMRPLPGSIAWSAEKDVNAF